MSKDLFIIAVAAGIGYFLLAKTAPGAAAGSVKGPNFSPRARADDAGFGGLVAEWEGWRYYDSGYAKDPAGAIYYDGQKVS